MNKYIQTKYKILILLFGTLLTAVLFLNVTTRVQGNPPPDTTNLTPNAWEYLPVILTFRRTPTHTPTPTTSPATATPSPTPTPSPTATPTQPGPSVTPSPTATSGPGPNGVWNDIPSPNTGSPHNYLNGVAAIAPADVWAVGGYGNLTTYAQQLIHHW